MNISLSLRSCSEVVEKGQCSLQAGVWKVPSHLKFLFPPPYVSLFFYLLQIKAMKHLKGHWFKTSKSVYSLVSLWKLFSSFYQRANKLVWWSLKDPEVRISLLPIWTILVFKVVTHKSPNFMTILNPKKREFFCFSSWAVETKGPTFPSPNYCGKWLQHLLETFCTVFLQTDIRGQSGNLLKSFYFDFHKFIFQYILPKFCWVRTHICIQYMAFLCYVTTCTRFPDLMPKRSKTLGRKSERILIVIRPKRLFIYSFKEEGDNKMIFDLILLLLSISQRPLHPRLAPTDTA